MKDNTEFNAATPLGILMVVVALTVPSSLAALLLILAIALVAFVGESYTRRQ